MRKICVPAVLVVALAVVISVSADDKPWFDMANCAFCKHMLAEKGLMEHMDWEWLDISNGVVMIARVDKEYREAYDRANKKMEETGKKVEETGKMPPMCGSCARYGELMMLAGKPQHVQGKLADVLVWTSDDPEIVNQLQEYGKRNMTEMAAFDMSDVKVKEPKKPVDE